jgi:hypothetical protein
VGSVIKKRPTSWRDVHEKTVDPRLFKKLTAFNGIQKYIAE